MSCWSCLPAKAGLSLLVGTSDRGKGRGRLYDNVTQTVGDTPCIRISKAICPTGRTIYAKLEYFNPLSSVKDRLACGVIEDAERRGLLKPGDTVIEATSGNTGIALAMVCAQRGYKCVITMAESFSLERRKLMRYLGARVIVTPRAGKGTGMVVKAQELAKKHGWFLCHQFESSANDEFHYNTTGLEILSDFEGAQLDYFVLGYGTGGTFVGAGRRLREHRPEVKICLAEPAEAPLLASGQKTERRADGSATGSHPLFAPHPIQGWTPDFIAKIVEDGVDGSPGYDEYMAVPGSAAVNMSQMLAKTQGIFTGISGGASMHAAVELAKKAPEGSVLLVLLADTGERYFSTPLFANINESMNDEELAISRSTPSFQM
ncbi:cysK [Symbiodinium sp. CCMP2456]|nr:cysK [Symbiodinium sp. CCMP2456]